MSTHNICFYGEIRKIIQNYHQILLLNNSSELWLELPLLTVYPVLLSANVWWSLHPQILEWISLNFSNCSLKCLTGNGKDLDQTAQMCSTAQHMSHSSFILYITAFKLSINLRRHMYKDTQFNNTRLSEGGTIVGRNFTL